MAAISRRVNPVALLKCYYTRTMQFITDAYDIDHDHFSMVIIVKKQKVAGASSRDQETLHDLSH